jgi:hypothetical protein
VRTSLLWRACNLTAFKHSSTGPLVHPLASRREGPGFHPLGGTYVKLLALFHCIGDPDVIDHCGLICGGVCPEPSLGRHDDNVIIPLDLTQLFYPGFPLAVGPPSGFTTDIVGCWGEPFEEPAISLHSYTVLLV